MGTGLLVGGIACPLQSPDLSLLNLFLEATSRVSFMKTLLKTEDLLFQIHVKVFGTADAFSKACTRIWCVAALPAVQSLAATWNSCCELTENNTITLCGLG
jgi:hypothetical protein